MVRAVSVQLRGGRVGLIVGRTLMVDCNRQIFSAKLEERTVEGWGYNYFTVTNVGQPASTPRAYSRPS